MERVIFNENPITILKNPGSHPNFRSIVSISQPGSSMRRSLILCLVEGLTLPAESQTWQWLLSCRAMSFPSHLSLLATGWGLRVTLTVYTLAGPFTHGHHQQLYILYNPQLLRRFLLSQSPQIGPWPSCTDDLQLWFPPHWPLVRGIHRSLVNSPHKVQWRGALIISAICASTNGRENNWKRRWFETPLCLLWRHCNGKWS